jgi:hypothetical protein
LVDADAVAARFLVVVAVRLAALRVVAVDFFAVVAAP